MKSVTLKSIGVEKILRVLMTTLGVLLFSVALFAQGNFGRILGTVTDQTGAVLPGATVTVTDAERGTNRVLTTDAAGEYNAPTLLPSTYTVRVEANGFKRLERPGILLEVGKELRVDLTPQPGDQTQTVTVTESIPLVDATSATLGGALTNAEINDLPLNGRNYQNLLGLRPGVMLQPGGSPWTQSTNNVRPDETVWMVDGIINSNFFDNRPIANMPSPFSDMATILPVDAIQEFNIEENPKAEYGWKPGAVVNVGIRSGTNTLHGSAYAFGRDVTWDARNFFNVAPGANGSCIANPSFPAVCDQLPTQLEQFGAVVGGRIIKDKLFFFGGYEGLRSTVGNAFPIEVPATASLGGNPKLSMADAITALNTAGIPLSPLSLKLAGCTAAGACTGGFLPNQGTSTGYLSSQPNVNVSDNYIGKMDYNLNDKNRINGMIMTGHYSANGIDHAATNSLFTDNVNQATWTVSGNWVYTPNSRMVNEFRVGYNRTTFLFDPADLSKTAASYGIDTGASTGGFPSIAIGGFAAQAHGQLFGSYSGRPLDSTPNPYTDFQDSVSYLAGKHALKFGVEFAHIEADDCACDQRGQFFFGTHGPPAFAGPTTPLEDFFAGDLSSLALLTGKPNLNITWNSMAGFIQDDWRVSSKLMINLGLRYTYVSPMSAANNALGNFIPGQGLVQQGQSGVGSTLVNSDVNSGWSPRIGFAYDLNGKGTTVIRGGASMISSLYSIADFVGNPGAQNVPGGLSLGTVPTGACLAAVPIGGSCPSGSQLPGSINFAKLTIPGPAVPWNANNGILPTGAVLSCTAAAPCNAASIAPNLKYPYVVTYTLGIQHQFAKDFSLDVAFVGNHGDNLLGTLDINECQVPNTGACVRPYASQYPYLNYINQSVNDGRSNYNSLQTTLTKRLSHGLNFTAGYTYGHGLDTSSLNRFGGMPQNSYNQPAEYGSSDYDTRHRFTLQASYAIPGKKGFGELLEGWKLNGIVTLATGQPWLVDDTGNNFSNNLDNTDRWNFYGNPSDFKSGSSSFPYCTGPTNCSTTSGVSTVTSFYSAAQSAAMWAQCTAVAPDPTTLATGGCYVVGKSVMTPPKAGTYGTMGRNTFYDPGFKNFDFSIFKDFRFKERFGAEFRFEVFNAFNHPNLANPYGGVVNSAIGNDPSVPGSFGCGCGTPDIVNGNPILGSGSARDIQLGLKLTF